MKPSIVIGNPHALGRRTIVELPGITINVPLHDYDSPLDAVVSQLAMALGALGQQIADVQMIVADMCPVSGGIMLRTTELQDAIDRLHRIVNAYATMRAAQAERIAETSDA